MTGPNALTAICDTRLHRLKHRKQEMPEAQLLRLLPKAGAPRGFAAALQAGIARSGVALITEIKRASPSGGAIREGLDVTECTRAYASGGATCLSILTEPEYFQGADEDLVDARRAAPLPALRKDFMLDPYQIVESRCFGADCVLLIMAALSDAQAAELEATALALGMDVLIEIHDEAELERALKLESRLLGINNRNLKTLETDLSTSEHLAARVPDGYLLVGESGIRSAADIARLQQAGIHAFLVGESLLRQPDLARATQSLLENGHGRAA